jgi:uncharacterized protein (DUF2132 family)
MAEQQHKDPLHGITLEMMLTELVAHHGWEKMGQIIDIRCFNNDQASSASVLKDPWARTKVEELSEVQRNALKKPKETKRLGIGVVAA